MERNREDRAGGAIVTPAGRGDLAHYEQLVHDALVLAPSSSSPKKMGESGGSFPVRCIGNGSRPSVPATNQYRITSVGTDGRRDYGDGRAASTSVGEPDMASSSRRLSPAPDGVPSDAGSHRPELESLNDEQIRSERTLRDSSSVMPRNPQNR